MRKVPKLRFKEFSNEWKEKKLGEISEVIKQKADEINDFPILTISAGKGFINQEDRFSKIIAGKSLEKYTLLKKNEFSYNRGNSKQYKYGCIYKLNNYEIALVPNVYRSFKLNKENPEFYFQLFQKKYLDNQLKKIISSSARMDGLLNISEKDFFDVKVPLTLLKEQEKIASFLTNVDKKISLTEEKLELFREYKKGVMQKIFSQELRFKDNNGNDYPEWEEKKLEDIVNINKGKQLNKELLEKQGEYPVINGGILPSGYTDKYNTLSNTITISEGGNSCGYVNFIKNNFWAGGHCYTLNKKIEINYKYLYQLLKCNEVNIMDLRVGSGLPNIQKSAINNYKINISTTLEEQQKIADFLSSIDSKIESIEKELERLKEFKRGLLQQMFV